MDDFSRKTFNDVSNFVNEVEEVEQVRHTKMVMKKA